MNTLLYGLDDESMATLLYLELDLATWRGRLVSAGHPPPVLLDPDGGCRLLDGARSAPLGAVPFTAYAADEVRLAPGATLIFYTDGLIERRRTPFGTAMDQLMARVTGSADHSAQEICDEVIAAALEDGPLADDAAVLVVQRAAVAPHSFTVELPAIPSTMPAVRRRVEHFLRAAGASADESYEIVTSTCEACANAIQHAYGARDALFTLSGVATNGSVELRVSDKGRWREPARSDTGGRGLLLMRTLMHDVRIARTEQGTEVTLSRKLRRAERSVVERH